MTRTDLRTQISMPGQTHVAEGPHDQTGMYLAHHAFRRDLADFAGAVDGTPLHDHRVWAALSRRWSRFAEVLHHHHTVEDEHYWPMMLRRVRERGDQASLAMLQAMEAEHAEIDPALEATAHAFSAMATRPTADRRRALATRIATVRTSLSQHLRHEETEALPLLQEILSEDDFAVLSRAALAGYPPRVVLFLIPWAMAGVPATLVPRILAEAPAAYRLVLLLFRPGFVRRDRLAFRYA